MFDEAASKRIITHEPQRSAPLSFDEIFCAVKGRYALNPDHSSNNSSEWGVSYRPYRDQWILLLLSCNERLFALQVPKAIPSKITAQYEEEEQLVRMKESLARGEITFAQREGMDRKYLAVKDVKALNFASRPDTTEGNIYPQEGGLVVFEEEEKQLLDEDAFNS
jgi:hypothetical protein